MITRLYLRSLALGLATAATFWPATHHWLLMGVWCALASVFVVDMIHAALTMTRIEGLLLSKPVREYFQFCGVSERPSPPPRRT